MKPVDVLFILDASGSVGPNNFELEKQFVVNVLNGLNIGSAATQSRYVPVRKKGEVPLKD